MAAIVVLLCPAPQGHSRPRLCLAIGLTVTLAALAAPAGADTSAGDLVADSAWVQTATVPSGAITLQTDRLAVWPYVGNYAAIGLADQAARTGDSRALAAAWAQVDWYAAAEGPTESSLTIRWRPT